MTFRHTSSFLALAAAAVALAGCGGTGGSPSVASLGNDTTTTTADSSGSSGGGSLSSGSGGGRSVQMKMTNGAEFATCMRKNGVRNFPDPSANGSITFDAHSGVNPNSPVFKRAQETCQRKALKGGEPTPEQAQKMQRAALAFSRCMRAHGVHDFPDPQFSGGGMKLSIKGARGSDLNPSNPTFRRAQQACQDELPGKGGPGTSTR